jgi:hypothetical protein
LRKTGSSFVSCSCVAVPLIVQVWCRIFISRRSCYHAKKSPIINVQIASYSWGKWADYRIQTNFSGFSISALFGSCFGFYVVTSQQFHGVVCRLQIQNVSLCKVKVCNTAH